MALNKNITLKNNFGENTEIKNAYIKVACVETTKENSLAIVEYKKNIDAEPIVKESFNFKSDISENSKNALIQAYLHLKTLPEFDGAVDC